ncbi:MAG: DUF4249 family protein [Bacteroidales bacterium]|nr:DUF4249 family protein [Bacteroidales bacterium]
MKKFFVAIWTVLSLASCKEEMDFDYHTVAPIDVIEAYLTQDGLDIQVTQTTDMECTTLPQQVDALVTLTDQDGQAIDPDSTAVPGQTYTLQVQVGDRTYSSTAQMCRPATIESATLTWDDGKTDRLFCTLQIQDVQGEENHYCFRMFRNGEVYKWGVFTDKGYEDGIIERNISCMSRDTYEDNKPEDQHKILHDGDQLRVEVLTIDQHSYDYLYSLSLSKRQSYNPICNFEGGCLGYFIAGGAVSVELVFHDNE